MRDSGNIIRKKKGDRQDHFPFCHYGNLSQVKILLN